MSHVPSTSKGPIHLRYDGGQVVVTPEDEDRFVVASRQAVSACQSAQAMERFVERFKTEVLARLRRWCEQHESQVTACYVPTGSTACLKVFVVAKQARFDFDLADSITDLEADLDGAGWPCDILQIASGEPEELAAFFDPHDSIQVYGQAHDTP